MIYIYTDTLTHKPDHRPTNKATNMGLSPGDWRAIGVSEEGESFAAMGVGAGRYFGRLGGGGLGRSVGWESQEPQFGRCICVAKILWGTAQYVCKFFFLAETCTVCFVKFFFCGGLLSMVVSLFF
jgi:hypothetical protein